MSQFGSFVLLGNSWAVCPPYSYRLDDNRFLSTFEIPHPCSSYKQLVSLCTNCAYPLFLRIERNARRLFFFSLFIIVCMQNMPFWRLHALLLNINRLPFFISFCASIIWMKEKIRGRKKVADVGESETKMEKSQTEAYFCWKKRVHWIR